MTKLTDAALRSLLDANPDLQLVDDRERPSIVLAPQEAQRSRPKPVPLLTEFQMQASIFAEIEVRAHQDPRWGLIAAVPNGQYRHGERMEPGLRAGFPDIICPIPRRIGHNLYSGLAMELKVGNNTTSEQQDYFLHMLKGHGWYTCVVYDDPAEAIRIMQWYLGSNET